MRKHSLDKLDCVSVHKEKMYGRPVKGRLREDSRRVMGSTETNEEIGLQTIYASALIRR